MAAVDPEVAVICVRANNRFGHHSPDVMEQLIDRLSEDNSYQADVDGTTESIADGERLRVRTGS